MVINGLQKLTLLDFPGRTACTVFLAGCDFACPFCHNFELTAADASSVMTDSELLSFLEKRFGLLDGVAITGGEPTLQPELPQLMEAIKALGYAVKLDTNGNNPEMLSGILKRGLADYVAMDIKNSQEKYARTIGCESFDISAVSESVRLLRDSNINYEFRTTVVDQLHDEDSFLAIGPWIDGAPEYYLQAFADRDTVPFSGFSAPSKEKMEHYADLVRPYVGKVSLRGI